MKRLEWSAGLLAAILTVSSLPLAAEEAPAQAPKVLETAEQIRACARDNFPRQTSVQSLTMIAHDRSGGQRTLQARMYWRLDDKGFNNVMIRVYSPNDLSGSSYLVLEREERDDMFMYLPAIDRSRRIVGGMRDKPLWGTDLSYEDIKHLQGVAVAGKLQRLDDGKVDGRDVYVIESSHEEDVESPYGRVISHVDNKTCVPLKVEFFDRTGEAVKTLTVDPETLAESGGRWRMQDLKMLDLHSQTHTDLKLEELESDEDISSRVFSIHTYHHGG